MTGFIFYFLAAAISSILTNLYLWRSRQWTNNDYYALVQKYSEAASTLTSLKAELHLTQERLELSEDIRYTLGMENAKLAKRISELEMDIERGQEVRCLMAEMLGNEVDARIAFGNRLVDVQRSLRIARHKEFKRWKKMAKKTPYIVDYLPLRVIENMAKADHVNRMSLHRTLYRINRSTGDKTMFHAFRTVCQKEGPLPLP